MLIEGGKINDLVVVVNEDDRGPLMVVARAITDFIQGMDCEPISRQPATDYWEAIVGILMRLAIS